MVGPGILVVPILKKGI